MERKQVTSRPSTLKGLSSNKAYPGQSVKFYDDSKLVMEIELEQPFPTHATKIGSQPGFELEPPHFFKSDIIIEQPRAADIELFID